MQPTKLNRFVAYHILPHGTSYWYLTYYDGKLTNNFVDTDVTDISTWYSTLMPHASLKCSYPMAGDDSGLYLNHRGLKSGPDKYGKQVRGAKITACKDKGKDPFTRWADNGCYFYIDRPLTYDLTTRDDVLGSELWRVDFKTLLPDVMNNVEELRGDYLVLDDTNHPNDNLVSPVGRSFIYSFDCLENVEGDKSKACPGLIARRADSQLPDGWQGDAMYVLGDFGSITLKLPPLPAGEWEVRLGSLQPRPVHPDVRVSLNGEVLHLKDGTTLRYPNGRHEMTRIKFYDYVPPVTYYNWSQTQHDNGYYSEWEVSKVWHVDRQFSIGVEWTDNTPQTFQPRYGLCFGTEPGLTIDNCLYKAYCADVEVKYYSSQTQPLASIFPASHYMLIGPNIGAFSEQERFIRLHPSNDNVTIVDTLNNCIKTALEPGKTYYYRPFTEVQATEHGKFQTKVTYSRERSFRVPRVMADFGYYPRVKPSEEALNAFYTHFPDHVVVGGEETATQKPAWDDLEPAWDAWRESEEGKQTDISADISSDTFDDGTGYRLSRIPDEFYTWLTHREVVVDAFDGLTEYRVTSRPDSVSDIDAKWGGREENTYASTLLII